PAAARRSAGLILAADVERRAGFSSSPARPAVARSSSAASPKSSDGDAAELLRATAGRSEEHTSELQSQSNIVCRLLLEKKKNIITIIWNTTDRYRHATKFLENQTCNSSTNQT